MTSFDFREPDHVTAGAVGEPGARVFYLQARQGGEVVSLRLEKEQVFALCEYLGGILNDLAPVDEPLPTDLDLVEPVVAEWIVHTLAVAYEEADDRILLVAEELVPGDDSADEEADETPALGSFDPDAVDAGVARFRLTRAQVLGMITHARTVVAAGRPICPVCLRPMDPTGHFCPRNN